MVVVLVHVPGVNSFADHRRVARVVWVPDVKLAAI